MKIKELLPGINGNEKWDQFHSLICQSDQMEIGLIQMHVNHNLFWKCLNF